MHVMMSKRSTALAKILRRAALMGCLLGLLVLPALGTALKVKARGPIVFYTGGGIGGNQVSILSEAALEDFTSIVNRLSGELRLDPRNLETLTSRFIFDLTDLKTGLEIRDKAMQGPDWFDTARYPRVEMALNRVESAKKTGPGTAEMITSGTCTVHGVTRKVRIPVTLAYLDASPQTAKEFKGDVVRIRGQFEVKLSDYGVTGPKGSTYFVGVRVADVQKIRFTVYTSSERPETAASARGVPTSGPA